MSSNPLWDFTLASYQRDKVASLSLRLQDEHGVNVCILFTCLWMARQGHRVDKDEMSSMVIAVEAWDTSVVWGLRNVRKALKKQWKEESVSSELYQQVLALELQAEQCSVERLYALCANIKSDETQLSEPSRRQESRPEQQAELVLASLATYAPLAKSWGTVQDDLSQWLQAAIDGFKIEKLREGRK